MNTTAIPLQHSLSHIPLHHTIWPSFVCVIAVALSYISFRGTTNGKVYDLGGIPLWNTWAFFTKRYDFMRYHLRHGRMFRFKVKKHRVLSLQGFEGRKAYFNEKNLDLGAAFYVLQGGGPTTEGGSDATPHTTNTNIKRMLKTERLELCMPMTFKDLDRQMTSCGPAGTINPFEKAFDLVFQMIFRMGTCSSLSEDPDAISEIAQHFWVLETGETATSVLLPWLPSQKATARKTATRKMAHILSKYVTERRSCGAQESDPIDVLIREGSTDAQIITFIIVFLFVAIANTGITLGWVMVYLGHSPQWKALAKKELEDLISKYTDSTTKPFHVQLSSIPLSAWESELPVLDAITRETIRLNLGGFTSSRRNIGDDLVINGVEVKRGDFVVYNYSDVHLNPDIYTNPLEFDPGRYEPGREEDKKVQIGYLGWGFGRHPCFGMRAAKLQIKWVMTMLLVGYNYDLVDKYGKLPKNLPELDRNDNHLPGPVGDKVYLKFTRMRM